MGKRLIFLLFILPIIFSFQVSANPSSMQAALKLQQEKKAQTEGLFEDGIYDLDALQRLIVISAKTKKTGELDFFFYFDFLRNTTDIGDADKAVDAFAEIFPELFNILEKTRGQLNLLYESHQIGAKDFSALLVDYFEILLSIVVQNNRLTVEQKADFIRRLQSKLAPLLSLCLKQNLISSQTSKGLVLNIQGYKKDLALFGSSREAPIPKSVLRMQVKACNKSQSK
jgi:hypothetical protein